MNILVVKLPKVYRQYILQYNINCKTCRQYIILACVMRGCMRCQLPFSKNTGQVYQYIIDDKFIELTEL